MTSWKEVGKRVAVLFAVALTGLAIHGAAYNYYNLPMGRNELQFAYVANLFLAGGIMVALMRMPERLQGSLGFLYLGGSLLKFLVFFLLFYPDYKADGDVSKLEFATFFMPYALCLAVETTVLVRMLNKQA